MLAIPSLALDRMFMPALIKKPSLRSYFADISCKNHVTNDEVCAKIQQAIGPHEDLLTIVKRRRLKWYRHFSRSSGLAQIILRGTVKGGRRQGRQKEEVGRQHQGMDRPGVRQVPEGSGEQKDNWRKLVGKSSVVPQQQLRLRDR